MLLFWTQHTRIWKPSTIQNHGAGSHKFWKSTGLPDFSPGSPELRGFQSV